MHYELTSCEVSLIVFIGGFEVRLPPIQVPAESQFSHGRVLAP
jgi:hypothetical protein